MFFLSRYCKLLEETSFRGRTADFFYMLIFGGVLLTTAAPFVNIQFLGHSLTFMMVSCASSCPCHLIFLLIPLEDDGLDQSTNHFPQGQSVMVFSSLVIRHSKPETRIHSNTGLQDPDLAAL